MAETNELMSFEKFKSIMTLLQEFNDKRDTFSSFLENYIATDSWCFVTFGLEVEDIIINMLADHFRCWYSFKEQPKEFDWWNKKPGECCYWENDITAWLYSMASDEGTPKTITVNDKTTDVTTLEDFYKFLVDQYQNLTQSQI